MKKSLICLITLFIALSTVSCGKPEKQEDLLDTILKRDKLIVGVKYDTKPFGFVSENNSPVGFDIDLAKMIAKEILGNENKVEFVQVTPATRIMTLNSNKADMIIATMSITNLRNEVVDFSKPYYLAGQALLVDRTSRITSVSELNGKKVIIVFGSTAEKNIRSIAPEAVIIGYKNYVDGYNALKAKKANAMTSDDTILMGFAMSDKSVKLLPRRYSKEPYAIAFRKGDESKRLRDKVDFILDEALKSGKINQIKAKWINL